MAKYIINLHYVCMYVCMMYACMHVCMYACMHIYIYTYTHMYRYIYICDYNITYIYRFQSYWGIITRAIKRPFLPGGCSSTHRCTQSMGWLTIPQNQSQTLWRNSVGKKGICMASEVGISTTFVIQHATDTGCTQKIGSI